MWPSYRKFVVERIVPESVLAKSFYLIPADGGPLAPFLPGQHLPLRLKIPGQNEPVYRFYTLSDCDNGKHYRLTIKKELPPPAHPAAPAGLSSSYLNDLLRLNEIVEGKAPAGDFFLDIRRDHPVIFIAGGIGVTPLLSMLNAVVRHQPTRDVWFFYALRHAEDHVFKDHLESLVGHHPNIHYRVLYEQASAHDRMGIDYHHLGRINVALLSAHLPTLKMEYYICGPDPMMKAVSSGLLGAGVQKHQIRTESFGPSSTAFSNEKVEPAPSMGGTVTFQRSGKTVPWDPKAKSLWQFAEQSGVEIESGCLYGDCGTCLTRLLSGEVIYNHPTSAKPDPGTCLPCSCRPQGSVVIDA